MPLPWQTEQCKNVDCARPYQILEIGGGVDGCNESETIRCPHCGHSYTERTSGDFDMRKLLPDDEVRWLKRNKAASSDSTPFTFCA